MNILKNFLFGLTNHLEEFGQNIIEITKQKIISVGKVNLCFFRSFFEFLNFEDDFSNTDESEFTSIKSLGIFFYFFLGIFMTSFYKIISFDQIFSCIR